MQFATSILSWLTVHAALLVCGAAIVLALKPHDGDHDR